MELFINYTTISFDAIHSVCALHEGNAVYESIKSYGYDEYQPIEGDVLKADDTRYADADLIALTNND